MTIVARKDFEPADFKAFIDYVKANAATRSPWPMPASVRPRISAACCS